MGLGVGLDVGLDVDLGVGLGVWPGVLTGFVTVVAGVGGGGATSVCSTDICGSPSLYAWQSGHVPSPRHSAKLSSSFLHPSMESMESKPSAQDALQYLLRRSLIASPCHPP